MCHLSPTEAVVTVVTHPLGVVFCVFVRTSRDNGLAPLGLDHLGVLHQHPSLNLLGVVHKIERNRPAVDDHLSIFIYWRTQIKL